MRKIETAITRDMDGREVKSVLRGELSMSSSFIKRVKVRENGITLNGERAFTNARVKAGDILAVEIADSVCYNPSEMTVYEDEDILIINKPSGMEVHRGPISAEGRTVKDVLAPDTAFHPVNRLDRGTSGLMAIAKSGYIHDRLRKLMHTGDFIREYLAVTEGVPSPESGVIRLPIARDGAIKRVVSDSGADAVTEYETVGVFSGRALVRLRLKTGRTHQIRVHMSAIGCPLLGDWLYGTEDKSLISRPALHSARIALTNPVSGKRIDVSSPLPTDIVAANSAAQNPSQNCEG